MECPPTRAEAWLEEHSADLTGLRRPDAVALVEGAGLRVRILEAPGLRSPEVWEDRLNLHLAEDATVVAVSAG